MFFWVVTCLRAKKPYLFIGFFILFSGNDWLGSYLNSHELPKLGDHLEWWTIFQYSSITSQLFWVPHQATIAWLGTILTIGALRDQSFGRYFLVLTLGLLWSPFVVIGLLPFGLLFLNQLKIRFIRENHFREIIICIFCFPLAFILTLYFQSKSTSIAVENTPSDLWTYLQFIIFEWVWVLPFLFFFRQDLTLENKKLLLITSLSLTLIPFCHAPGIRDFIMRASMPSLFCLIFILMSVFRNLKFPQSIPTRIVMGFTGLIMLFSWLTPAFEMIRSIARYSFHTPELEFKDQVPSLWPPSTAQQYLGQTHSAFFKYFSRIPHSDSK